MIFRVLVLLIINCVPDLYSQSINQVGEEKKILDVLEHQMAAWNRGDINGYMAGYWKSDSLIFTSGGKLQRGWQSTYEKYKLSYDSKDKMGELIFSDLEIKMLSAESAWVLGRWELKRQSDNPKGIFTLVFRKFKNGWKIIHDHTSVKN